MRATDRKMLVWRMETSDYYRAFSHDVTAAILVFQNNQTVAILVFQTNPVGVELFLCKQLLLFPYICILLDAGHVSEIALYQNNNYNSIK